MFDLSLAELALIVVVATVFIGPKELPVVLRAVARGVAQLRKLGAELRAVMDEVGKESGIAEAAQEFKAEMRMIRGDDGKFYESYDLPASPHLPTSDKTHGN